MVRVPQHHRDRFPPTQLLDRIDIDPGLDESRGKGVPRIRQFPSYPGLTAKKLTSNGRSQNMTRANNRADSLRAVTVYALGMVAFILGGFVGTAQTMAGEQPHQTMVAWPEKGLGLSIELSGFKIDVVPHLNCGQVA
jgi:hypothetical protein